MNTGTLRHASHKLNNLFNESWMNVKTRGINNTNKSDGFEYATISYISIARVIRHLNIGPRDCFVDIGCGKGRVICYVATLNVGQIIGVEYEPWLASIARRNITTLRWRRSEVQVIQGAAEELDYDRATVIYLYNPFGAATLRKFLTSLKERTTPQKRIVYLNPLYSHVFEDLGFEVVDRWTRGHQILEHDVIFYSSV